MKKRHTYNLGGIICLVVAVYVIYYLLLRDNLLPFSISSVLSSINHWARNWHILVVGLMPVYIAFMLFGTSILGAYLGSALQRWISQFLHNK